MKKKIAFICLYSYPSICGVWSRVYNLGKMLIKEGHEVHVFSTNIIKGTKKRSGSFEEYGKIKIHRFNPRLSYKENLKFWNFSKELKIINPDIIIAEVYRHPHTSLALKISRKLNKPCYLVTHAPFVEASLRTRFENFLVNSYDRIYGKKILNKFTKIITITRWEIPYLLKLGLDEKKIGYIPNGIPEEFFKYKQKKGSDILFLGRISPIKDLETLIFAMNELIKVHPNLKLKITGPSEEEYKLKLNKLITKLKLDKNISFHDAIYDIKKKIDLIDSSNIFVLPSKREAMPQSILEAMARNKIVISSNNKGSEEIIKDKLNGFLFEIGNYKALAEIINNCLDLKNEKLLEVIRKNAHKKSLQYKWIEIFKNFKKLIINDDINNNNSI